MKRKPQPLKKSLGTTEGNSRYDSAAIPASYVTRLVETLPAPLKDAIPSVAELERGLTDFSE